MPITPRFDLPYLGYGLGLRTVHYPYILEHWPRELGWFEIISENFMESEGRPRTVLEQVRAHYDVVMHGVSLSIGSTDALDVNYLNKIKGLIDFVQPEWVSDHLCWTGVQGGNTHDLLPLPYTEEALRHVVDRIRQVQDILGRPLLIENPSSYVSFQGSGMPEAEFIARMSEAADCALLLDVNNVYVSCFNHRLDCKQWLDTVPLERVVQVHLAGHSDRGNVRIDTHDQPVPDDVWQLYRYVIAKMGRVSTMVEWDADIPEFPVVLAEVMKAKTVAEICELPNQLPDFTAHCERNPHNIYALETQMQVMQDAIIAVQHEANVSLDWVVNREDLSAKEQIGIYQEGYVLRLSEVIANACPAWVRYVGEEEAEQLLLGYVRAHPSHYYNLNRYASEFPAYVALHCDAVAASLVALEVAMDQVFDAPQDEPLTSEHLAALDEDAFGAFQLKPRAALRLLHLTPAVSAVYRSLMEHGALPDAEDNEEWLAVFRDEDVVYHLPLEKMEYVLLQELCTGERVADVCERHEKSVAPEEVQRWFSRWVSHRLFQA